MKPTRTELALAGLALAFGLVSACSNGSNDMTQSGKGAVQFVMSASAATPAARAATSGGGSSDESQLQSANVTFASILARNLDGELLNVTIDLPVIVDLIGLVSDGTFTLPAGFLPSGTYDQIVIVMTKVELTLANGTVVTIDPPGGGWTAVLPVADTFTVADGQTTTVTIHFRGGGFHWLNGEWEFHPDFDCHGDHGDGHDD
jgi:hypothetical protein